MPKTNKTLIYVVLILSSAILFYSCKKETQKTKTELLTNGTWVIKSYTINPGINFGTGLVTNIYSTLASCEKDNITQFLTNQTYTITEGATKCNATDPQVLESGTWKFTNNEQNLELNSGSPTSFTINSLTDNNLDISLVENIAGTNYTFTIGYSH
jgi:hypothetical protein